jgi:hypothetical protein
MAINADGFAFLIPKTLVEGSYLVATEPFVRTGTAHYVECHRLAASR